MVDIVTNPHDQIQITLVACSGEMDVQIVWTNRSSKAFGIEQFMIRLPAIRPVQLTPHCLAPIVQTPIDHRGEGVHRRLSDLREDRRGQPDRGDGVGVATALLDAQRARRFTGIREAGTSR